MGVSDLLVISLSVARFLSQSAQFSSFLNVLLRLQTLLEELSDEGEGEVKQMIVELYKISNESPHVWKLIKHLVEKLPPTEQVLAQKLPNIPELQSKPTISSNTLTGYMEQQFPFKDWYVEIDYVPGQYNSQEAKLYVTLTDEPSNNSGAHFQLQSLGYAERIAVGVEGLLPYFDPIGSSRAERLVSPDDHRTTFDFKLRPRETYGSAVVTAKIFLPDRQDAVASANKAIKLSPDTLDLIMTVWKEGSSLYYSLRFGADLSNRDVGNQQIEGDANKYFEKVYAHLNRLNASK